MSEGLDWGGEELQNAKTRMSSWYKCQLGHVDVIRVVSKCFPVWKHTYMEKGRFCTSMCSLDVSKTCPVCDRAGSLANHKRGLTFAVTILHLTRQAKEGKPKFVGRLLAWRFGDEKKQELLDTHDVVKKRGGLTKVDLRISLKGDDSESEKFQKTSIRHMDASVIDDFPDDLKKRIEMEVADKAKVETIRRLYLPTAEDLAKFFKEDDEASEFVTASEDSGKSDPFDAGGDPLAGLV